MNSLGFDVDARALRFTAGPSDCLYHDHLGRRVVADVEGSGEFRIEKADVPLQIEIDETDVRGDRQAFSRNLLAASWETGEAVVSVRRGFPSAEKAERVSLPVNGCGWVVAAERLFQVDERHEAAPMPDEFLAIPFFTNVSGEGKAKIVRNPNVLCERVDAFDIHDTAALTARGWKVQNVSRVSELASTFADGTAHTAPVASHLNAASWRCPIPEGCLGLRLRRIYDRFHGRQRARVLVDGRLVGWWYEPAQDRQRRWAVSEIGIADDFLVGKSEVELTIDPPAGAPLWSVSRMEVLAFLPA